MRSRNVLFGAVAVCLLSASAHATLIFPDFVRAELPPNSTTTPLPFLLNPANDTIFLKFKIPNVSQILAINSFVINVDVFDDDDGGGETGEIQFALPGQNEFVAIFGPSLNHITGASPAELSISLCPCQIDNIFSSLQDGTFRIKVLRDSGDFFVAGGSAVIDATLAPEPRPVFAMATGLLGITIAITLRRKVRTPAKLPSA